MKINKISVTGVFNYTDDALFEDIHGTLFERDARQAGDFPVD